jgi:hypothetical protein
VNSAANDIGIIGGGKSAAAYGNEEMAAAAAGVAKKWLAAWPKRRLKADMSAAASVMRQR